MYSSCQPPGRNLWLQAAAQESRNERIWCAPLAHLYLEDYIAQRDGLSMKPDSGEQEAQNSIERILQHDHFSTLGSGLNEIVGFGSIIKTFQF